MTKLLMILTLVYAQNLFAHGPLLEAMKDMGAIFACMVFSVLLLGFACNFLCLNLDQLFRCFGGQSSPELFIINGIVMAVVGGY